MTERYEKSPAEAGLFEWNVVHSDVAERGGFEPPSEVNLNTISSRAP